MQLTPDQDVLLVLTYMQRHVPAARLVAVARSIGQLAPIVWDQYETEGVAALRLRESITPSACDLRTQPTATE